MRWLRSVDPLVPVVALTGLVVYALHGFEGTLTRDLALYSYAGQQVAEGVPPYLGVMNRAGPLAHAIPGLGVTVGRLVGLDDVLALRMFFCLVAAACLAAVYLLGRDLFASRTVGVVTAATFVTFTGFIHYASNGPREKTPMTLFVVVALWAATRRRWFTAGLFVSLATLCLQIAFFASAAAVFAAVLLLAHGTRIRALGAVVLGGTVPVAALAVWFALAGSLRSSVEGFVLINARYTEPDPLIAYLEPIWLDMREAYGASTWLLIGGLAALLVRSLAVVRRSSRDADPALPPLAALSVGVVAGLLWNLRDYDAWPDLFPVLPLAAVGIGAAFDLLRRRVPVRTAAVAATVAAVLATTYAGYWAFSTRSDALLAQRRAVAEVLAQLPADATITSIEAPQPLVLTRRTNPTRHQMFRTGLQYYLDDTWPGGLDGFRRDVIDRQPDLIAFGDGVTARWRAFFDQEYVHVGDAPDWSWYARRSLDESTLADLRRAAGPDVTP